ncbi:zinc ribbon domain-containing protein [Streptomyces sp. NPDC055103]
MKLAVRVKPLPTPEQAAALEATLRSCNEAANWLSVRAFEHGRTSRAALQVSAYAASKARGLSVRPALHVLRKVADAYTALKVNLKAGNLGKRGSKRNARAAGKPVVFQTDAAQPFDDRCLSWQMDDSTVSIWAASGHMKGLVFAGQAEQLALLAACRKGESDLLLKGYVDAAYISRECSRCHHVDCRNRPSQAVFACQVCGFVEHADLNSSRNIAARGWWTWVRGAESQARPNPGGITADPLLRPDLRLGAGCPAPSAGTLIADNGGRDRFGNAVSATTAPNIGAYEGPGRNQSRRRVT